jgi:hypothetical protein
MAEPFNFTNLGTDLGNRDPVPFMIIIIEVLEASLQNQNIFNIEFNVSLTDQQMFIV